MKSSILFFLGGIATTFAVCSLARCPKTRELWEKGLDKGKQAKQKAMDTLGHLKDETSDPAKALSEIKRVLKKDGIFLLCDTWAKSPLRQVLNVFIRFSNDGDVHIYSKNEVNKLLTGAGLNSISWELITNHAYLSISKK